jgi:ketosteroid isomerase-like protein
MATYVDEAIWEWRGRRWCHLTADTEDELHAMAARLGLVRQWFQAKPERPWSNHYDLPEEVRVQAIACGARPLTRRETAQRLARLRKVHVVRCSFEAFARGDFSAAFAAYDPAIEWSTAADEPDQRTYRGIEEVRALVASLADPWANRFDSVMEFEPMIAAGECVVVPWRARLRGRSSGVAVEIHETYLVRVRARTIVAVREFRDREQAVAAAGGPPERVGWNALSGSPQRLRPDAPE